MKSNATVKKVSQIQIGSFPDTNFFACGMSSCNLNSFIKHNNENRDCDNDATFSHESLTERTSNKYNKWSSSDNKYQAERRFSSRELNKG